MNWVARIVDCLTQQSTPIGHKTVNPRRRNTRVKACNSLQTNDWTQESELVEGSNPEAREKLWKWFPEKEGKGGGTIGSVLSFHFQICNPNSVYRGEIVKLDMSDREQEIVQELL
jgi:hypothetical protein